MREFKKRRSQKTELLHVAGGLLGLLCLLGLTFSLGRGTWDMYGKFASAAGARQGAEIELMELRLRHAKVQEDVESFQTERGLEGELRERYGVARPGEGEISIVRKKTEVEAVAEPQNAWGRFLGLFGL